MTTRSDAQLPEVLSDLLLALYAACDFSSVTDFQRDALRLIQERLPFDSAFWAAGVLGPRREPVVLSVHLFNQPDELLASYERVKHLDTILARAVEQFGTTVNVATAEVFGGPESEPMWAHGERFGIRHVLATMTSGPISELLGAISLYRADPANPFSERDRMLKQCLAPHLVTLCNRNRMQHVESSTPGGLELGLRATALVNREGMLYNANVRFVDWIREEWPDWHGPFVPPALATATAGKLRGPLRFTRVAVHVARANDLLVLRIRPLGACDSLSEREWEVAKSFGEGLSHKEIAGALCIAPSTVRNHLRSIYEKLGVANKAELVHSLASAPR